MTGKVAPVRDAVAAMLELVTSQRPDLLPAYLDMASNSPARFAVLELASELGIRDADDFYPTLLKIVADLDRLERRRGGWKHPRQIVQNPNIAGLLYFCRARISNVSGIGRRRRLEVMARKLQRVHDREKTRAWITDFIGTSGRPASQGT